jgi:hypothetical protein
VGWRDGTRFDPTGSTMSDPTCDRCENEVDSVTSVTLLEEHELCEACRRALSAEVLNYDWRDRYTKEQHERATELLAERDEIECVINSYEDGQIVVHTPYVSSDVITDFCNHFGFVILSFGPQWHADGMWPCVDQHGDIFEIVLEYNSDCPQPVPISAKFFENHIERVDGNDEQFDRKV